jgi:transposase
MEDVHMSTKLKRYTQEFKTEAVRLVKETGKPVPQIAADVGISDKSLYRWLALDGSGARKNGSRSALSSDEREDLQRLRDENRTLRMERDFLKKSVAFFARETTKFSR